MSNPDDPKAPSGPAGPERSHPVKRNGISRRAFFQAAVVPFAIAALPGSTRPAVRPVEMGPMPRPSSLLGPQASRLLRSGVHPTDHILDYDSTADARFGGQESNMGIVETSLTPPIHGPAMPGSNRAGSRPPNWDAYELLEKCHQLGGRGIQTELNGDLKKLRMRAEQLGMWIEGMVSVPRNGDTEAFEQALIKATESGAIVVRTALLGGRRYESFTKLEDWNRWVDQSRHALEAVVPLLDRHKITLAIENHKDWTLGEMQSLLKTYESKYLGVCFDFGNNLALLDDPMEMAVALAPYVRATHVKDMAVRPYQDGFLLSEVPLGAGLLDLAGIVSTLRRANPELHLSLEMITRDPLKVPCLTPGYWEVFPDRNGRYLARTLKLLQEHGSGPPLPSVSHLSHDERLRVEEDNVKVCLRYALDKHILA